MPVQTRSQVKAAEKLAAEKLSKKNKDKRITATLVTEKRLAALGLDSQSRDPSGYYRIVLPGPLVEFKYLRTKNEHALYGKWAIAPEGYYWASSSDKAYYNFDWYYLSEIPISSDEEEDEV
jgi:hypothetical protein